MRQCKIGFVGVGKMAGAILQGALNANVFAPSEVAVCNRTRAKLASFEEQGCVVFEDIISLVKASQMVVLGVKPQDFSKILPLVKEGMAEDTVVISIAAGVTAEQIQKSMGFSCKVILAMPNTPLLLGKGATGLSKVEETTQEEFDVVKAMFSATGMVEEVHTHQMSDIIPISGSSPAYLYLLADVVAKHALESGMPFDVSMRLFCQTMVGSAAMLQESGKTPEELIEMVSSPGGTTIAGMKALKESGFVESIHASFDACLKRAEELSMLGDVPQEDLHVEVVTYESPLYEDILQLREQVMRVPLGLKNSDKDVEDDDRAIHFAVLKGETLVGTGQLLPLDAFIVQVRQVAVGPDTQKRGVGKKLMQTMEAYAKEHDYQMLTLNARETAMGFYSALGYKERGAAFPMHGMPHMAMYKDLDCDNENE